MIADLLEPGESGEDRAAPVDALRLVDPLEQVIDDGLVEAGLLAGQSAVVGSLDLALNCNSMVRGDGVVMARVFHDCRESVRAGCRLPAEVPI